MHVDTELESSRLSVWIGLVIDARKVYRGSLHYSIDRKVLEGELHEPASHYQG